MKTEEAQVYPELAKIDSEGAQGAETEHTLVRDGLATLSEMIGQPGFGAIVAMLTAGLAHHVKEEEDDLFPKLRKELGLSAA